MISRFARVMSMAMLLGACAPSGGSPARTGPDRMALTAENLRPHAKRSLYEVIRLDRPQWLATRGPTSFSAQDADNVVVYRDGQRLGGPEHLSDITADVVSSVRFLSGPEAQSRYGMNHQYGAILVTTVKR